MGATLRIDIVMFDGFEPLDVFGPVEVLGCLGGIDGSPTDTELRFVSLDGGTVRGSYGVPVETERIRGTDDPDVVVMPGGAGTRPLVCDGRFLTVLRGLAGSAGFCLTVCTGSVLLAGTGLLDGHRATSNKRALSWVKSVRPQVDWIGCARWVRDGRFVTSSGVSAGIDMALGFIASQYGSELAECIAHDTEYIWNNDPRKDPFASPDINDVRGRR